MVKVLMADDNVEYVIGLMNDINKKNENIKVCNIAKNGKEAVEILNTREDIDIILLDYKMPIYNADQVLEKIEDKNKYYDSFIIISGEIEEAIELRKSEMVHAIIDKITNMDEVVKRINELFEMKEANKKAKILKNKITRELLYLGYDISHKGTQYLIKAIEYIAENPNRNLERLEKDVYSKIAVRYQDTTHNIKCRINNATTAMYYNCEIEKLKQYFTFSIDTKPKIKTIINTILNKIQY